MLWRMLLHGSCTQTRSWLCCMLLHSSCTQTCSWLCRPLLHFHQRLLHAAHTRMGTKRMAQVTPAPGHFSWFYGTRRHAQQPQAPPAPSINSRGDSSSGADSAGWESLRPAPCRLRVNLGDEGAQGNSWAKGGRAAGQGGHGERGGEGDSQAAGSQGPRAMGLPPPPPPQQQQQGGSQHSAGGSTAGGPLRGARLAHAGELLPLTVDVWSSLPVPIMLTNLCLALRSLVRGSHLPPQPPPPQRPAAPGPVRAGLPPPPVHHHARHHSAGAARPASSHTAAAPGAAAAQPDAPLPSLVRASHSRSSLSTSSAPDAAPCPAAAAASDASSSGTLSPAQSHVPPPISSSSGSSRTDMGAVGSPPSSRPQLAPAPLPAPASYRRPSLEGHPFPPRAPSPMPSTASSRADSSCHGPSAPAAAGVAAGVGAEAARGAGRDQQQQQQQLAGDSGSSSSGSSRGAWSPGPDLECKVLLRVEWVGGAGEEDGGCGRLGVCMHRACLCVCARSA